MSNKVRKPKNKLLKLLLSSSLVMTMGAFQVQAHTVQEAVAYTLQTSPDLLVNVNIREEANKDFRNAYADYLPKVDVTGGVGPENSDNATTRAGLLNINTSRTLQRREFSLAGTQLLFDGFGVMHNVEGKKSRVKAASYRVDGSAQDVAEQVVESFLEIHLRQQIVDVAQKNLDAHQSIYSQIEKRSEGGIGRKADLDQAIGRLARARTNLLAAKANLEDAKTTYLRIVGQEPRFVDVDSYITPVAIYHAH